MQENYLKISKVGNLINLNFNSLYKGNTEAIITTPSGKTLSVLMKDNKNGSLIGKFKSIETTRQLI